MASDEEEDEEMANELFEAQTLEGLSQSRSEERRRQHASPHRSLTASGAGEPPDGDDGSDPHDDPYPVPQRDPDPIQQRDPDPHSRRSDPAGQPPALDPLAPVATFAPSADCIPGSERPHVLVPADCNPWLVEELNDVAMVSMLIDVLFSILPTAPGWLFPFVDPPPAENPVY